MKKSKKIELLEKHFNNFNKSAILNGIEIEKEILKCDNKDEILKKIYELKLDIFALGTMIQAVISEDKNSNLKKDFNKIREAGREAGKKINKKPNVEFNIHEIVDPEEIKEIKDVFKGILNDIEKNKTKKEKGN